MSSLNINIPTLSDLALQVMMRVIEENEQSQRIQDEQAGPLPLAAALSDFFQLASSIENGAEKLEPEVITEIAQYALDLLDRLAQQLRVLDIHDQRDPMAKIFVSLALWFARQGATLDNLSGTAEGFANLVNSETDKSELAKLTLLIQEVLECAADELKRDEGRADPWRPWRVLNLNSGIAATRSLDPVLMQETFDSLVKRLPDDMPNFFADGQRRMKGQNVPEDVRMVMEQYAKKWPASFPH